MSTTTVEEPMHEKIFRVSLEWCERHPGWKRICDIPDSDALYKTWDELPAKVRRVWEAAYHSRAEDAWREFGSAPCRVEHGYVGVAGVFYPRITDLPMNTNFCAVYLTGESTEAPA